MRVVTRHRVAPRFLLSGLVFGVLGALAWAQAPSGSQEPPPPPEPQAPPPADRQTPPPADRETPPSVDRDTDTPPPLDAPRTEAPPALPAPEAAPARAVERGRQAEDHSRPTAPVARTYVPHEPPPPVAERPSGERPGRRAVWTPGYWEWDADSSRFLWVAGSWRVPPAGMAWSSGRWLRDPHGWYWVDGSWTRRAARPALAADRPAWRTDGPPANHPDDTPPPAPGPDFFYVPGHYAPTPAGDRLAWVPGFWSEAQDGWDWIPARWVRRPDGWDYREGHWIRDGEAVVDRGPARVRPRRTPGNVDVNVIARDPITGAEVDVQAMGEPVAVGGIVTGMPYYVIRPAGYPYGPTGVVVPGTVPPFVRRILDRVLP